MSAKLDHFPQRPARINRPAGDLVHDFAVMRNQRHGRVPALDDNEVRQDTWPLAGHDEFAPAPRAHRIARTEHAPEPVRHEDPYGRHLDLRRRSEILSALSGEHGPDLDALRLMAHDGRESALGFEGTSRAFPLLTPCRGPRLVRCGHGLPRYVGGNRLVRPFPDEPHFLPEALPGQTPNRGLPRDLNGSAAHGIRVADGESRYERPVPGER